MYHIILVAIAGTMLLAIWNLVHSSPRALVLLLPPTVAIVAGTSLLIFGSFFAFAAAVLVQNGDAMLGFLLKANVGFYILIVRFRDDEALVRRSFTMVGAMYLTIIAIFYVQNPYAALALMLGLLAAGYYVLTSRSRFLDPER